MNTSNNGAGLFYQHNLCTSPKKGHKSNENNQYKQSTSKDKSSLDKHSFFYDKINKSDYRNIQMNREQEKEKSKVNFMSNIQIFDKKLSLDNKVRNRLTSGLQSG